MALILDSSDSGGGGAQPPADAELIKESNTANFTRDVLEASMEVPVIVDFWAPWCGPCKQLGPMLERAVKKAGGLVRMVKVNVDENQDLAMQLRVQSVPMVYGFKNGQPVDGFTGALPESQIQQFIDRLTGGAQGPVDQALDQARDAMTAGQHDQALAIYQQVLQHDPENAEAAAGLIRGSIAQGNTGQARAIIGQLSNALKSSAEVQAAISALELAEEGGGEAGGEIAELEAKVEVNPADPQARFDLAKALYAANQPEAAVDELIELIRRDRAWNEGAAKTQLLKIFEALGSTDPVTVEGRRKLSSVLFA